MAETRSFSNPYLNTLRPGRGRAPGLSRAVGNRVYRTNPVTGNLELATSELSPTRPLADAVAPPSGQPQPEVAGGLDNVFALDLPRPPSLGRSIGQIAGGAAAAEGVKRGVGAASRAIGDTLASAFSPAGRLATNKIIPGGMAGIDLAAETAPADIGDLGSFMGGAFDQTGSLPDTSGFDTAGFADAFGDAASVPIDASGFGDFFGGEESFFAEGGGVPVVGPAIRLAQGDVKGAAGSAIGGAIGSTFGPVGTAVGSFIGGSLGGGCYITEAVTAGGGADNSPELETLRWFRDSVLTRTPQGQELVAEYEQAAPAIVEAIAQRPDAPQILGKIRTGYIQPAVEAIRRGQHDEALRIYADMSAYAAQFAIEITDDPELEQLLEEFAQDAAEVSHDSEMAGVATATGNELVHPGDQVASQPRSQLGRIFIGG